MKTLNELFNKGRAASPPLTKSEVENIILNSSPVAYKKGLSLKNVMPYALSILAIGILAFFFIDKEKNTLEKENTHIAENQTLLKDNNNQKFGKSSLSKKNIEKTEQQSKKENNTQQSKTTFIKDVKQEAKQEVKTNGVPISKTGLLNDSDSLIPLPKLITAIDSPPNREPIIKELEGKKDSIIKPLEEKKKSKSKKKVKKHKSIHFIKADFLGYFYDGVAQQLFVNTNYIDPSSVWGNKVSLGYENLFHPNISLGAVVSYGFSQHTFTAERDYDTAIVEKFENYKGLTLNIEGRYYFKKSKGDGFYLGAALSYGYIQERVFVNRNTYHPGEKLLTVAALNGHSFGGGLVGGFKYQVGRFYIEPNVSYMFFGGSKGYLERGFQQEEEQSNRYKALSRYEINFGYRF